MAVRSVAANVTPARVHPYGVMCVAFDPHESNANNTHNAVAPYARGVALPAHGEKAAALYGHSTVISGGQQ